jgi:hypothetical protein
MLDAQHEGLDLKEKEAESNVGYLRRASYWFILILSK